jgi:epoxyqueuosine reductase
MPQVSFQKSHVTQKIKKKALDLGFDKVGIAKVEPLENANHFREWLSRQYHGEMAYMENNREVRLDPIKLVENAKSVISVVKNYYTPYEQTTDPAEGMISRYAWGDDYHDVLRPRLKELLAFAIELVPESKGRVFVDSAPIMDKQWAIKAGLGWQGKHSNVISREFGSWIFLAEVVVDFELDYDQPIPDYCGTCTRCIEACPTGAITEPYVVDATRCISYLTIELKSDQTIPTELQRKIGNHIFGCDICQDVCPWNLKFAKPTHEQAFQPRSENLAPNLQELSRLTEEEFKRKYRKSPIKRPKHKGFLRSVDIALKNAQRTPQS